MIFEWCVVECESKNWHQEDMCIKTKIGKHAHTMVVIMGSIANMMEGRGGGVVMYLFKEPLHMHFK